MIISSSKWEIKVQIARISINFNVNSEFKECVNFFGWKHNFNYWKKLPKEKTDLFIISGY